METSISVVILIIFVTLTKKKLTLWFSSPISSPADPPPPSKCACSASGESKNVRRGGELMGVDMLLVDSQEEHDCCHSFEDVHDPFRNRGWSVTNPDLIDKAHAIFLKDWVHKSLIDTTEMTNAAIVSLEKRMGAKIATLQLVNMEKYNYLTVDFFKKLLQF
ncbi:uncharacterized protein LOC108855253 isoform X1 [Raphanus sativus]|uniref:Uncharacterized protein LOC108855253 isoform X1 n=1 Tax=Raphanus sativus TaxID=3726 RepID=A0A9W3DLC4_RAPSA|nr:uncharacterized protein LOC108855253 isoform X1 [Raphanus sativus]